MDPKTWGADSTRISNVTFVNSYNAIRQGPYSSGCPNIENVYISPLHTAAQIDGLADVGRFTNIHISPDYWLNSGLDNASEYEDSLRSYIKENATGIKLGRIDWSYLTFAEIEGCHHGLEFTLSLSIPKPREPVSPRPGTYYPLSSDLTYIADFGSEKEFNRIQLIWDEEQNGDVQVSVNGIVLEDTASEKILNILNGASEPSTQGSSAQTFNVYELSAHKDGESVIVYGVYKGLTLTEYIREAGSDILGTNVKKFDYFPILIKLIDAKDNLSVQVHPDDEYAIKNEGEYGKTEMWYILDCEEGASLYYGFQRDVTKDEYKSVIESNTLTDILNSVPVHKGDVFFIPAGTVHAIGAGIMICEIQQNSNTTYRVYDYGRRDKNGNTRELHIDKALEASTLTKSPETIPPIGGNDILLAQCKYFTVRKITVEDSISVDIDGSGFRSVIVSDGSGTLEINYETISLEKGDSIFIPAQSGRLNIHGNCTLILSHV